MSLVKCMCNLVPVLVLLTAAGNYSKGMNGTRCAKRKWWNEISTVTGSRDYRRLQSCPFIKMYDEFQIYVLVHGDDFYIIRDQKGISNAKEHFG